MNFRSWLIINPRNSCSFKVFLKLCLLTTTKFRFDVPSINHFRSQKVTNVLRLKQFYPHIINYTGFWSKCVRSASRRSVTFSRGNMAVSTGRQVDRCWCISNRANTCTAQHPGPSTNKQATCLPRYVEFHRPSTRKRVLRPGCHS